MDIQREEWMNLQTERQTDGKTYRWMDRRTGRRIGRQTGRWMDRRTNRQIKRCTDGLTLFWWTFIPNRHEYLKIAISLGHFTKVKFLFISYKRCAGYKNLNLSSYDLANLRFEIILQTFNHFPLISFSALCGHWIWTPRLQIHQWWASNDSRIWALCWRLRIKGPVSSRPGSTSACAYQEPVEDGQKNQTDCLYICGCPCCPHSDHCCCHLDHVLPKRNPCPWDCWWIGQSTDNYNNYNYHGNRHLQAVCSLFNEVYHSHGHLCIFDLYRVHLAHKHLYLDYSTLTYRSWI